jgi:Flp pilus assembly protein TadD
MRTNIRLIPASVVVCIFVFGACNSSYRQPEEIPRTATEAKKAELLRQVELRYKDPEAHYQLGKVYQGEGLWAQAEHEFSVALSFVPVHRPSQAARVKVLASSGDTAGSKSAADIYMKQAFTSATGSLELAMAFQKEGFDEYAFACYQRALALAPNSARVNRQVGYYYLSKGEKDRAKNYLVRSFQLNTNQPEVANELGKLGVPVRLAPQTQKSSAVPNKASGQGKTVTPKK